MMRHPSLVSAIVLLAASCSAAAVPMIVGGDDAAFQDFPYQVRIEVRQGGGDLGICGGSLIGRTWVLTAAHCVTTIEANPVPYAAYEIDVLSGSAKVHELRKTAVRRVFVHPGWRPSRPPVLQNDIAVLELEAPLTNMRLIKLPSVGMAPPARVTISGWGLTSNLPGSDPENLKKAVIRTVDNDVCNQADAGDITDRMLCAGEVGKGFCHGDSGGPATTSEPNWADRTLVGIISRMGNPSSTNCANANTYDVLTRVSAYRTWIDAVITPQPPPAAGDRYRILNLGPWVQAMAINNSGLVAGINTATETGTAIFIVEASGANKRAWPAPLPSNAYNLQVEGISDSGRVLITGFAGRGTEISYVTGPEGAAPVIDVLSRYPDTSPLGITADGRIFGRKGRHFFITEPDVGVLREIVPNISDPSSVGATGGNSRGQVVGVANGLIFISEPNGGNLRQVGGFYSSRMNERGEALALVTRPVAGGGVTHHHTVVIDVNSQEQIDLGDLCGRPLGINDFGVVTGHCGDVAVVTSGRDSGRRFVDIEPLLDSLGWHRFSLHAINNRGQIVGTAQVRGNPEWKGIVLEPARLYDTPPETP